VWELPSDLISSFHHFDQLVLAIAAVVVYPPWIWLAVSTKHCLKIITRHAIPFPKRTIWLIKIFALIISAGGMFGIADSIGTQWFIAVLPAGLIVYFALKEKVQDVVPPKPVLDAAAYRLAWDDYWRLRSDYLRSYRWLGAALIMGIVLSRFTDGFSNSLQIVLGVICISAVIGSIVVINLNQLKWMRWPCPRCGCSFRGFWGRAWLPKRCAYCGLPREEKASVRLSS
jgi:hypothetical protein